MRFVGAGFVVGALIAFALALRVPPIQYRGADFQRSGVSTSYAERQATRANRVAAAIATGESFPTIVQTLEAAFAVPWYASGRGPGEDSLPLRPHIGIATHFIARDPNSPWYRRAVRGMSHDAQFVGRRSARFRTDDGREIFAGELVEDRAGVTFRTGTDERCAELVADALVRLERVRRQPIDESREALAAALRAYSLAMPYGERSPAFAEALVLGTHLAIAGETFRLNRDARAEFDRAAWTAGDAEDFAVETGFAAPTEPARALSQEDGGV